MFAYSMRERTLAHKKMVDDVPQDVSYSRQSVLPFQVADVY